PVDVKDTSGYTIDNDPYLYAFDVAKQAYFRVARHDTSWATVANSRQVTHPHPSFTPDDSAILFSSDKDGKPAVYIAKLPSQPEMLKA
ncbi:MAG: oligogalacturonate lyase family protein, partial [Klebsiella michiganensis]|nr:oligogalacturonate lyase family protein [Klebsiella michiganensis]